MADTIIADLHRGSDEWLRVSISEFRGKRRVDVRVFALYRDGKNAGPTPKGISVGFDRLPELIQALERAKTAAAIARPTPAKRSTP